MTVNAAPMPVAGPPGAAPDDWTEHGSIFQPRQAAFWLYVLLLVVSSVAFVEEQAIFAELSMAAWVGGLVLLALYAVPVYLLVTALDQFEREPRSLLLGAVVWGGIIATFLAAEVNGEWSSIVQKLFGPTFARDWGAALVAPGVEELVKFLGVVVLYLIARHEFDDLLDGFVYGALVGLGFTVVEDMYYFFVHFVGESGSSDIGGLLQGAFIRLVVGGPYSHVLLTGLTGMGLAYYVTRPDVAKARRLLVGIGLYAAGVLAHFIWNSPLLDDLLGEDPGAVTWVLWAAIKGLPFLILLGLLVRFAIRHEQRWIRDALAPEVASGLVTAEDVESLVDLRRRRQARSAVAARTGGAGERLAERLQHAQIELAIAGAGSAADRETRLGPARDLVHNLQVQLAALISPAASPVAAMSAPPFSPMHRVPPEGLSAWAVPDASGPSTTLAGGLDLQLVRRIQDWAEVRAVNGWQGWVDARRLMDPTVAPGSPPGPPPG